MVSRVPRRSLFRIVLGRRGNQFRCHDLHFRRRSARRGGVLQRFRFDAGSIWRVSYVVRLLQLMVRLESGRFQMTGASGRLELALIHYHIGHFRLTVDQPIVIISLSVIEDRSMNDSLKITWARSWRRRCSARHRSSSCRRPWRRIGSTWIRRSGSGFDSRTSLLVPCASLQSINQSINQFIPSSFEIPVHFS